MHCENVRQLDGRNRDRGGCSEFYEGILHLHDQLSFSFFSWKFEQEADNALKPGPPLFGINVFAQRMIYKRNVS